MQQTQQRIVNDPAAFGVAVLMGGWSAERAVSLNSGQAVHDALQAQEVDAHGIDVDVFILHTLADGEFDRAFTSFCTDAAVRMG